MRLIVHDRDHVHVGRVTTHRPGDTIAVLALPDLELRVDAVLA